MNRLRKQSSGHVEPPFLAVKLLSFYKGDHWLKAIESGCGLCYKSAAMALVGSYKLVNLLKWNSGMFRGSMGLSDFH